jgi:predicted ferric reductase
VQQALVPFTSDFQTGPLSLGLLSLYIGALLVLSTYLMAFIGFKVWRAAHYAALIAWGAALSHGLGTGHDTNHAWALALYMIGAVLVAAFLVIMILRMVSGAAGRATQKSLEAV